MNPHANLNVTLLAVLAALATIVAAPMVAAQDNQTGDGDAVELQVSAHDSDGGAPYWFEVEGYEGRNPTIVLAPGTTYNVTFENAGNTVHNFHVGDPVDEQTAIIGAGESETLQFTVGDTAPTEYWCDPHRGQGMTGDVVASEADLPEDGGNGGGNGDGENGTPGFTTLVAVAAGLGAALLVYRRD